MDTLAKERPNDRFDSCQLIPPHSTQLSLQYSRLGLEEKKFLPEISVGQGRIFALLLKLNKNKRSYAL
jgi:hypothetical protein